MVEKSFSNKLILFLSGFSGFTAYGAIFVSLLISGLGLPIPEDITLVSAGLLAALGKISLAGALGAGFVGVLIGDTFLFFLGRNLGTRVFNLPGIKYVFTKKRTQMARQKVINNSKMVCFVARFLPGLRAPIYLTAGIMGVRPLVFFSLDGLAALLSVPLWVMLGWWFGHNIDDALHRLAQIQGYIFAALGLFIVIYIVVKKRSHHKKPADAKLKIIEKIQKKDKS